MELPRSLREGGREEERGRKGGGGRRRKGARGRRGLKRHGVGKGNTGEAEEVDRGQKDSGLWESGSRNSVRGNRERMGFAASACNIPPKSKAATLTSEQSVLKRLSVDFVSECAERETIWKRRASCEVGLAREGGREGMRKGGSTWILRIRVPVLYTIC
eukprot:1409970-Rhodomonas_salina.1